MLIAHAILVPIRFPSVLPFKLYIALVIHFHTHTDPPIEWCPRAINLDIRNSGFDNLGYDISISLISSDADFRFASSVALDCRSYRVRQLQYVRLRKLVECIGFVSMFVGHWNAGLFPWGLIRFGRLRIYESLVQELVKQAMLGLSKTQ